MCTKLFARSSDCLTNRPWLSANIIQLNVPRLWEMYFGINVLLYMYTTLLLFIKLIVRFYWIKTPETWKWKSYHCPCFHWMDERTKDRVNKCLRTMLNILLLQHIYKCIPHAYAIRIFWALFTQLHDKRWKNMTYVSSNHLSTHFPQLYQILYLSIWQLYILTHTHEFI